MSSRSITRRGAIVLAGLALAGCAPSNDPRTDGNDPTRELEFTKLSQAETDQWDSIYYKPAYETIEEA